MTSLSRMMVVLSVLEVVNDRMRRFYAHNKTLKWTNKTRANYTEFSHLAKCYAGSRKETKCLSK